MRDANTSNFGTSCLAENLVSIYKVCVEGKGRYPDVQIILNRTTKSLALSAKITRGYPSGIGALRRVVGESMSRSLLEESAMMVEQTQNAVSPHTTSMFPSSKWNVLITADSRLPLAALDSSPSPVGVKSDTVDRRLVTGIFRKVSGKAMGVPISAVTLTSDPSPSSASASSTSRDEGSRVLRTVGGIAEILDLSRKISQVYKWSFWGIVRSDGMESGTGAKAPL